MLEDRVDPSRVGTDHRVQLFDSDASLADAISAFLHDGFVRSETLLAIIDEQRWYAVAMRLSSSGVPVDEAMRSGQLTVCDAVNTLDQFVRGSGPDPELFEDTVGWLVRRLLARGEPLRVYGDLVNLLVARGEYEAAQRLEHMWNDLGGRSSFTLFCGYGADHFGDPRTGDSLRRICGAHTQMLSSPQDVLSSFLLNAHRAGG